MSNTIHPGLNAAPYGIPVRPYQANQTQTTASQFLNMAIQAGKNRAGTPEATASNMAGTKATAADSIAGTEAPSLEAMLKIKYPNLVYHVFDASNSYWRTRNDYPHYLLYQPGNKAAETMENWQPSGANPFYGSVDGRFIAPKEIRALGNVPPGSKAVVIHPNVQQRMDQDPEYAKEILDRIDTWFAFDVARNESLRAGSTIGMSQAVAIGEDGNICNAVSSRGGGEITYSSDEMVRAYYLRLAKRADFMRWLAKEHLSKERLEGVIQDSMRISDLNATAAAKTELNRMLSNGRLREILGSEIAGMPVETVLAITRAQIWGNL